MKKKKEIIKKPFLLFDIEKYHLRRWGDRQLLMKNNEVSLLGSNNKEFIPLFALNIPHEFKIFDFTNYQLFKEGIPECIKNYISYKSTCTNSEIKESIRQWITQPFIYYFPDSFIRRSTLTYSDAINNFFLSSYFHGFSSDGILRYIIGSYFIGVYDNSTRVLTPLVCMVTRPKYVPYLKLSCILQKPVNPDTIELWVNDNFDITNSLYNKLRSRYRKFIKKPIQEHGINIVSKSGNFINELILHNQIPIFEDIKEHKEWFNKIGREFIQSKQKESLLTT